jgi:AcrR family transcriptional regulator
MTAAATPPATRRAVILSTAAELFAQHGFHGVSIDDLGRALGVTGPALYRHFRNKEALLAEMLLDISQRLLSEGRHRVARAPDPAAALAGLLHWHIEFSLAEPALITVHERELDNVPEPHRREIRRLQRGYAEEWVQVLRRLYPGTAGEQARAATHAVFGLLNSTPRSGGELSQPAMARLLYGMSAAGLRAALG